jgi:hypothetical protein
VVGRDFIDIVAAALAFEGPRDIVARRFARDVSRLLNRMTYFLPASISSVGPGIDSG